MFPINDKYARGEYEYINLSVHCDNNTYRRKLGNGDSWEVQRSTGEWHREYMLGEIISELYGPGLPAPVSPANDDNLSADEWMDRNQAEFLADSMRRCGVSSSKTDTQNTAAPKDDTSSWTGNDDMSP